jgi:hypothetical protein
MDCGSFKKNQRWVWHIVLYGLLTVLLLIAAIMIQGYPDTWICRPYSATFDSFDDIVTQNVVSMSSNRGSQGISDPVQWNILVEVIQQRCTNILLLKTVPERTFQIDFQPNPDIADTIASIRYQVLVRALAALAFTPIMTILVHLSYTWRPKCCCEELDVQNEKDDKGKEALLTNGGPPSAPLAS